MPGHPGYQLSTALSHLQRSAGLTGRTLARNLGISPSLLSRILLGKRPPKWPVVKAFAELCGADPEDLWPLYEKARGLRVMPPPGPEDHPRAARALQTTLRGMWLAAGRPNTATLCRDGRFTPEQIEGALESDHPADYLTKWSFVAQLTAALRGSPDDVRALWEQMSTAFALARATRPVPAASAPPASSRMVPKAASAPRRITPATIMGTTTWSTRSHPHLRTGRWDWVLRTMDVLNTIGHASSPLANGDLARASGLTTASIRELTAWLEAAGLTMELQDGTHIPGPLLVGIHAGQDVPGWLMTQLRADAHAAVYISEYIDGELEAARSWYGPDTPPVHEDVPFRETAHANALGKASLAQLNSDQRTEHLTRHRPFELTASTITDVLELERSLTITGQRPVYYDRQEYNHTEKCAAVPLALPGRNACVGLSLPPASHSRIYDASRLLRGQSTTTLLSLVMSLTEISTPAGQQAPAQPVDLPHQIHPPQLQTTAGGLLTA
ncbi:helix-turn-helix domain-containing protein [Streptomyces sp. NPDC093225]|uniref:helix-turn-helix domain-containing protein n=1 Tax=Streptomyces sp. NPDC093225 TaxID=3366034 RepID=UPI00382255F1